MPHRGPLKLLPLLAIGVLLAGCSGLQIDAYPSEPGTARDCAALLHDLPERLGELDRRRVDGDIAGAWGDPPVVLRCGVPKPTSDRCTVVDGQAWNREAIADGTVFTATGRRFAVSLEVPAEHASRPVLADTRPILDKHDPVTGRLTTCSPRVAQ